MRNTTVFKTPVTSAFKSAVKLKVATFTAATLTGLLLTGCAQSDEAMHASEQPASSGAETSVPTEKKKPDDLPISAGNLDSKESDLPPVSPEDPDANNRQKPPLPEDWSATKDDDDPPALEGAHEYKYTPSEVCAGFRDDYSYWSQYYETPTSSWVTVDDESYYYCHTYPSNSWTTEEVVRYYHESPYFWGRDPEAPYDEVEKFYLWTPDYENEFMANEKDGWLYIDGVKAATLDPATYSMDPADLIAAYQNKEWNGSDRRWSDDHSTCATIVPEGVIEYKFRTETFSPKEDPNGWAYTGYVDAMPWWEDESVDYGIEVMNTGVYGSDSRKEPDYYGWGTYDESGSSEVKVKSAWGIAFADVPWSQQNRLWAVRVAGEVYDGTYSGEYAKYNLYAGRNADGLYAITDDGVELWRRGKLRQNWSLKMTEDCYISVDQRYTDSVMVYTNGKLYELLDDGDTKVELDHIVSVNWLYTDGFAGFTLSDDGVLRMCGKLAGNEILSAEIASGVVAADLSDERLVLYTDKTGKTYALSDLLGSDAGLLLPCRPDGHNGYDVVCLGEGSLAKFQQLYQEYCAEDPENATQEQFITDVSAAYSQANP